MDEALDSLLRFSKLHAVPAPLVLSHARPRTRTPRGAAAAAASPVRRVAVLRAAGLVMRGRGGTA